MDSFGLPDSDRRSLPRQGSALNQLGEPFQLKMKGMLVALERGRFSFSKESASLCEKVGRCLVKAYNLSLDRL